MKKIFLSYAKFDLQHAQALYQEMSLFPNVKVWFDRADLVPGMRWEPAIRKAIREARYFVALLSKKSCTKKGFRNSELGQAMEIMKEFPEDETYLIPTRIEECKPPFDVLNQIHFADLFPDRALGISSLRKAFKVSPAAVSSKSLKPKAQKPKQPTLTVQAATSGTKTKSDYHYQVRLVDLTPGIGELKALASGLNSVQRFVYLTVSHAKPNQKSLIKGDDSSQLYVDLLNNSFYKTIGSLEYDHVLCLTDRLLSYDEDGSVYSNYLQIESPVDSRISFGSVAGLKDYAAEAGVPLIVALSYVLVSEFTTYFLDIPCHDETRGCPLDFVGDLDDMVVGLKKGRFCKDCLKKLTKNPDLKTAVTAMLEWGR